MSPSRFHVAKRSFSNIFCGAMGLLFAATLASPVAAINIVLNFDPIQSEAPSFDPTRSGLISLFQHAESFYQDVFEDTHTLTINYWYEDLSNNTLGVHNLISQSGGRETVANIRIDTRVGTGGATRGWFIDSTPTTDTEFNMQQTLWRDLTASQRSDWYNFGSSPDTFEVGYTGNATATAAMNVTDMLSVVMHEVGHALGMSSANLSTIGETADGDYDFNSAFIFGNTLAVETANNSGDDGLNIAHLENTNTLMTPSVSQGLRRLPSHSDLLAMASGHNYVNLDVPRREFYGNSNWQNSGNWTGNTVPGSADDVYVRDAQGSSVTLTASLNANGFAANLYVSEGANVDTNAFLLSVVNDVIVSDLDSDIFVNPGGELQADHVFVQNSAEIEMSGGVLDANRVTIDSGTQIQSEAAGSVTLDVATLLVNNGTLIASSDSTMTLISTSSAPWDLDGTSGAGSINAFNGNIVFDTGGLSDAFDGTISVGSGHQLRIDAAWTNSGATTLSGGVSAADGATMLGGNIAFNGATINASGYTTIDASTNWQSNNTVTLADANTTLRLGNSTSDIITFTSGTFSGGGTLVQNGDATVNGTVNIDVGTFDFDGATVSDTTITSSGVMNITGTEINDAHDGVIGINGGTLNVNTGFTIFLPGGTPVFIANPWTMNGQLNFTANGRLDGVLVNITGDVSTTGRGIIQAPVDFESSGTVSLLTSSDILELQATTNYFGGSYTGGGRIEQDGIANFKADTLIDVGIFDWDGSVGVPAVTNVEPGVTATFSVSQIEVGDPALDGYDGTTNIDSGTLNVDTGYFLFLPPPNLPIFIRTTWRLDGTLNLNNSGAGVAQLNGSPVNLLGSINVTGTSTSEINASVSLNGGSITVNGGSRLQQDGALTHNTGVINVASGAVMTVNGTANMNAGGTTSVAGTMNLNNQTNFSGGSYTGSGRINQFGTADLLATTTFNVELGLRNGSTTNLPGATELRLRNDGFVQAGATISGDGLLRNDAGSELTLDDNSVVGVDLLNNGTLVVGGAGNGGIAALAGKYQQNSLGQLDIEIGGPIIGSDHDWLRVTMDAVLDGTLSVSLISGFVPSLGDDFDIITASSVIGEFSNRLLPVLGSGLGWMIEYDPSVVTLSIISLPDVDFDGNGLVDCADVDALTSAIASGSNDPAFDLDGDSMVDGDDLTIWLADAGSFNGLPGPYLLGDANLDGLVDVSDFNVWNQNKFTVNDAWCSGDFTANGVVDVSDFNLWNANKFSMSGAAAVVPEPELWVPTVLAFLALLNRRRSRRLG